MNKVRIPDVFHRLSAENCIRESDIVNTNDGFFFVNKSISAILAEKDIVDFPDSSGTILPCYRFFDDWFLYAVPNTAGYTYSLLKLREQEHDAAEEVPADGDTPGVTISFISFHFEILLNCLEDPTFENRQALNREINRVVARRGQQHHPALKQYFVNPKAEGAYLVATQYASYIASFSEHGTLEVPEHYKKIAETSHARKSSARFARLPIFIECLNRQAGRVICDHAHLYIQDRENPDIYETAAILATHTGNTSVYSFAAEVEYHARFLTPLAKIPFFGKSVYASAIRADMTVGDAEFQGPAPFYRQNSRIVKRQYQHHANPSLYL